VKSSGGDKNGSSKKTGTMNTAVEDLDSDSDKDCAFAMDFNSDCESVSMALMELSDLGFDLDRSMPSLGDITDSDWDSDEEDGKGLMPRLEMVSDRGKDSKELSGTDWSKIGLLISVDSDSDVATEDVAAHIGAGNNADEPPCVKVYNLGSTRHITPYCDAMENFSKIPPRPFRAANMQKFSAIGKGEMVVDIPNGADVSRIKLTEVLYSPEVGYTLMSVGHLDENRFTATFGNGKCIICGPDGEQVGEVVKNHCSLYRVQHKPDETNVAVEAISLDKFHRRMGHITPNVAKKLTESSFVTGVCLKTSSSGDPVFCESCVCKGHPKAREQSLCWQPSYGVQCQDPI
jgi:hypothetical protein